MESVCAYVQKNGPQDSSFRQPATPCILQIVHSVEEAPAQALDIQLLIDVVARTLPIEMFQILRELIIKLSWCWTSSDLYIMEMC